MNTHTHVWSIDPGILEHCGRLVTQGVGQDLKIQDHEVTLEKTPTIQRYELRRE